MRLAKTTRDALLGAWAFTLAPTAAPAATADTIHAGRDDEDFDVGRLGLLGLAGRTELKRKKDHRGNTRR